jgi:hypothetical protein
MPLSRHSLDHLDDNLPLVRDSRDLTRYQRVPHRYSADPFVDFP